MVCVPRRSSDRRMIRAVKGTRHNTNTTTTTNKVRATLVL